MRQLPKVAFVLLSMFALAGFLCPEPLRANQSDKAESSIAEVSTCPVCTEVSSISVDVGAELQPASTADSKTVAKPDFVEKVFISNSLESLI